MEGVLRCRFVLRGFFTVLLFDVYPELLFEVYPELLFEEFPKLLEGALLRFLVVRFALRTAVLILLYDRALEFVLEGVEFRLSFDMLRFTEGFAGDFEVELAAAELAEFELADPELADPELAEFELAEFELTDPEFSKFVNSKEFSSGTVVVLELDFKELFIADPFDSKSKEFSRTIPELFDNGTFLARVLYGELLFVGAELSPELLPEFPIYCFRDCVSSRVLFFKTSTNFFAAFLVTEVVAAPITASIVSSTAVSKVPCRLFTIDLTEPDPLLDELRLDEIE